MRATLTNFYFTIHPQLREESENYLDQWLFQLFVGIRFTEMVEESVITDWDVIEKIAGQNTKNIIIKNTSLSNRKGEWDISICDSIITAITEAHSDKNAINYTDSTIKNNAEDINVNIIDGSQKIAIPGLVDAHVHLDKCYLLDRCCAVKGNFQEAMTETLLAKGRFTAIDIRNRARRLIEKEISFGTTLMRTHVEVDPIVGLKSLEAIVQLRKEYEDLITIQIAVFSQEGITNHIGQVEMMREAMIMG
jgi:cytosine deaminase